MKIRCPILAVLLALLPCTLAHAQIIVGGSAPAEAVWNSMESDNYRAVYPRELDSLAGVYLRHLEQVRLQVGLSAGYFPNQEYRKKQPVILQAYTAVANGSVVWVPRRMDLNTVYTPYNPDHLRWERLLSIHESRHVAQMQFGRAGKGLGNFLFGDMFAGAMAGLYLGNTLLEGDAVVAETALTESGRGRSGDFLEYMRMAALSGDERNWYQWRWGSQDKYVPDYYRLGYMTIAGTRVFWDDPLFMERYLKNAETKPLRINGLQKTLKETTGKGLNATWKEIFYGFRKIWEEQDSLRKPSRLPAPVTEPDRLFSTYTGTSGVWSVRKGLSASPYLVKIDRAGRVRKIRPFAQTTSKLSYDGERLWWSEYTPDLRWELSGSSRIRYMEPEKGKRIHDVTLRGRYFNPVPAGGRHQFGKTEGPPEEDGVVAVEYPLEGGTCLVRFDLAGNLVYRYRAPDTLQLVEPVVITSKVRDMVYVSALSDDGFGIYSCLDGRFARVAHFGQVKIKQLSSTGTWIVFTCDMDGTDQIYGFDTDRSDLWKFTNTPYGASDGCLSGDGILTYTALSPQGKLIYRSSLTDLDPSRPSCEGNRLYPVAEVLSDQEKILAEGMPLTKEITISEPRHYGKARHLLHIHSWAPVYFNYNKITESSFEDFYYSASPGATVFFQNELETLYGQAGYSFHEDSDLSDRWRHSGHISLTYAGLLPVIQLSADYNDRSAALYSREAYLDAAGSSSYRESIVKSCGDKPFFTGKAKIYIPFNLSSGGWQRGIVPTLEYTFQNDDYDPNITWFNYVQDSVPAGESGTRNTDDKTVPVHQLSASLRAYTMLPTAKSAVYPKLGIGAEIGVRTWNASDWRFTPSAYAYVYGYLPGFMDTHGIRLSAIYQKQLHESFSLVSSNTVNTVPRGMYGSDADTFLAAFCPDQAKFSFDYALPLLPVDWSFLSPLAYIKNFEIKPFFDFTILDYNENLTYRDFLSGNCLYSTGGDISIRLSNLLWLPYDSKVGVRLAFNGGNAYKPLDNIGADIDRFYAGLLFSTSF